MADNTCISCGEIIPEGRNVCPICEKGYDAVCRKCLYDLGGGRDNCRLGVASECRDGGGYEAFKPKEGGKN